MVSEIDQNRGPLHADKSFMKYLFAWLVGVPGFLIIGWFLLNQTGC